MLEIEALSVSYGKREVLSRVSLSVKEGEVLAVLGLSLIHISEPTRH